MKKYRVHYRVIHLDPTEIKRSSMYEEHRELFVDAETKEEATYAARESLFAKHGGEDLCYRTDNGFVSIDCEKRLAREFTGFFAHVHPYHLFKVTKSVFDISLAELREANFDLLSIIELHHDTVQEEIGSFETHEEAKECFEAQNTKTVVYHLMRPSKLLRVTLYALHEIKEDKGLVFDKVLDAKSDTPLATNFLKKAVSWLNKVFFAVRRIIKQLKK